jgi:GT2 family glycosyltransferase
MNFKIAILILGYNHKETLKDLFDSVLRQGYSSYKVFYIDNASLDGSADYVRKWYPTVTITANYENLGYARGYDLAIRNAFSIGYDAAVLLNPDTVVDFNWLSELVCSAYSATNIALAQSKVLIWDNGPTNLINTFGNNVHFLGFGYCGHYKEKDVFFNDIDVAYASGSSLLIKKEFYPNEVYFDTDYFAYLEDQDLGWQARLRGLRAIASAKSKVWHKYDFQKKTLNNYKFYLLERNRLFFLIKFWSFRFLLLICPVFICMEIGVFLDSIIKGYFLLKIRTYLDFCFAIPKIYRKRKQIKMKRIVSDNALLCYVSPTIDFEDIDSFFLQLANRSMKVYFNLLKKLL